MSVSQERLNFLHNPSPWTDDEILFILESGPANERPQSVSLRQQALAIISESAPNDISILSATLQDLLTRIIKPLFMLAKHPNLTSTGRKNLVPGPPPSIANRFLNDPFEDEEDANPWKTPFTTPLLKYILHSYMVLPYSPPTYVSQGRRRLNRSSISSFHQFST